MKLELQLQLVEKFPTFFPDFQGDPMRSCMAFGFECGDGWFDLLMKLCDDIAALNPPEGFQVNQVKEKFGGLRFYASGDTDEIEDLISKAEEESYRTCEVCGSKDDVTSEGGWIVTRCGKCRSNPG